VSAAAEKVEDGVDFVRVCRLDELPAVGAAAADIYGQVVAIVRTKEGELYALDDTCSHANVSLSEGELEDMLAILNHAQGRERRASLPIQAVQDTV